MCDLTVATWVSCYWPGRCSSVHISASAARRCARRSYERSAIARISALYSLLAAVTLGFLIFAYNHASHAEFLWLPTPALRAVPFVLMPIAFTFLLGGFMTRNPTAIGQEGTVKQVGQGAGLVRVTRHPFQWSVVLWAIGHIVANGDVASLLFFGSLGTLSLCGQLPHRREEGAHDGRGLDCIRRSRRRTYRSSPSRSRVTLWCRVNSRCRCWSASSLTDSCCGVTASCRAASRSFSFDLQFR